MKHDQLCRANIENLTGFWRLFGSETIPSMNGKSIYASVDWPHRVWLDWETEPEAETVKALLERARQTSRTVKVPVWSESKDLLPNALGENGFRVLFRQTCMVLKLEKAFKGEREANKLVCGNVTSSVEADVWADVAARSFGYPVPAPVIRKVVGRQDVTLVLGYWDGAPAASGLLFENSGVIGIHMVGVLPVYRRLGIARQLMFYLHDLACKAKAPFATLQASDLGYPLYQELGYEKQFEISTYAHSEIAAVTRCDNGTRQ